MGAEATFKFSSIRQRRMCTNWPDGVIRTNENASQSITLTENWLTTSNTIHNILATTRKKVSISDVKCETDFNYSTV